MVVSWTRLWMACCQPRPCPFAPLSSLLCCTWGTYASRGSILKLQRPIQETAPGNERRHPRPPSPYRYREPAPSVVRNTLAHFALAGTALERNAMVVGNLGRRRPFHLGHHLRPCSSCKATRIREHGSAVERASCDRQGGDARDSRFVVSSPWYHSGQVLCERCWLVRDRRSDNATASVAHELVSSLLLDQNALGWSQGFAEPAEDLGRYSRDPKPDREVSGGGQHSVGNVFWLKVVDREVWVETVEVMAVVCWVFWPWSFIHLLDFHT